MKKSIFKTLLPLALALMTTLTFALEIQCNTNYPTIDIVIKKSPSTNITYLLPLSSESSSVTPIPLKDSFLTIEESRVLYKHEPIEFIIDLEKESGLLVLDGSNQITLSNCKQFD